MYLEHWVTLDSTRPDTQTNAEKYLMQYDVMFNILIGIIRSNSSDIVLK